MPKSKKKDGNHPKMILPGGYVLVRNHHKEAWRRKWCALRFREQHWLLGISPSPTSDASLTGEMDLTGASILQESSDAKGAEGPLWFGIQMGARVIHLQASSKSEWTTWVTALQNASDYVHVDCEEPTVEDSYGSTVDSIESISTPRIQVTTTAATKAVSTGTTSSGMRDPGTHCTDTMETGTQHHQARESRTSSLALSVTSTVVSEDSGVRTISEPAVRRRSTYDELEDSLEGWLHIKLPGSSRFKRYWFRLIGGMLRYYTSPESTDPLSVISLSHSQLFNAASTLPHEKKETIFGIKIGSTVYTVRAPSPAEKRQWLARLLKRTTTVIDSPNITPGSGSELGSVMIQERPDGAPRIFKHAEPLSGALMRRSRGGRWKPQWVELRIPASTDAIAELRWWEDQTTSKRPDSKVVGKIYLEDIQLFVSDDPASRGSTTGDGAVFGVQGHDNQVTTFKAASESIRSVWLSRLQRYTAVQVPHVFDTSLTMTPSGVVGSEQIMSGYLLKLAPNGRKWQQRWFVLTPHSLSYAKKPDSKRPLGYLPIRRVRLFGAAPHTDEEKKDKMIGLLSGDTMYTLLASSREQKLAWLAHLKKFAITTKTLQTASQGRDLQLGITSVGDGAAALAAVGTDEIPPFPMANTRADPDSTAAEYGTLSVGTDTVLPQVDIEGFLMLRSAPGSPWHRRYFTLRAQTLIYTRTDDSLDVLGAISLSGAQMFSADASTGEEDSAGTIAEKQLCLGIQARERFLELKANSLQDRQSWMAAIARAITSQEQPTEDQGYDTTTFSEVPTVVDKETRLSYGHPCGYLLKRGAHGPYWKRRWFYVDRNNLVYKKDHLMSSRPKGKIDITKGRLFGPSEGAEEKKRDTVFGIQTDQRLYVLRCHDKGERETWIKTLMAIHNVANPRVQGLGGLSTSGASAEFSGFLMKRSPNGLRWKQRWFYVTGPEIHYAETEDSVVILGVIHLRGAHVFVASDDGGASARTCFGIQSGERFFELKASSENERARWVERVRDIIDGFAREAQAASEQSASLTSTTSTGPSKTLLSGYLRKRGAAGLWWRRRFFTLTAQRLQYRQDPLDPDPLGSVLLQDCEVLEPVPGSSKPGVYSFTIQVAHGRPLILKCDNEESFVEWTSKLRCAIRAVTTPMPPLPDLTPDKGPKDDPISVSPVCGHPGGSARETASRNKANDPSYLLDHADLIDADSSSSFIGEGDRRLSNISNRSQYEEASSHHDPYSSLIMPVPLTPTEGSSDADKKAVATWIAYAEKDIGSGKSAADLTEQLAHLNKNMQSFVYIVNNQFTSADVALYKALHPVLRAADQKTREANVNVSRWFDHIQHVLKGQADGLDIVKFKRDVALQQPAASAGPVNAKAQKKADKKAAKAAEKAAKKAANKDKPKEPEAPQQPDVSKLDIRVGHIIKAWRHPDADSLYVEEIDVGEEKPRQVVSGLVKFIPEDQMQNRTVLTLCNLKPSKMRGIESAAMVLCATSPDGNTVEFVEPPAGVKPGDRVTFPGQEGEPLAELPKKQKIWEKVQPDFNTNAENVACWKDIPFTTSAGVCKAKTVAKGTIK